ncbi:TetR/AcrR family transcriptional regulator [Planctomonas deserti]|uniref:TetR/AcrR family transcriptional regulator n=1 Tax=Planctomonas deserti TaxID=2144185 RepID=UPI00131EDBC8|nr:TetR/AcrR family transcriptional regulator [Planctomonas deserti]
MQADEQERTDARSRRRAQSRLAVTTLARRLTAERGLTGFTVDELCEQVGISRRTFFNYFDTKEQAVIGQHEDWLDEPAVAVFLAARPDGLVGLSPTLMADLAELAITHMHLVGVTPEEAREFIAAVDREPQLLRAFMNANAEQERRLTELVARREGLPADDPLAQTAVVLIGGLVRRSAETFFTPGNAEPFDVLLRRHLAAAQAIFAAAP